MRLWGWNDAWILTAAIFGHESRGVRLAQLIAAADILNHVIPTHGQLSRAFSRLASSGLMKIRNKRYLVPRTYRLRIREAIEGQGGVFDLPDNCLKWLQRSGIEPGLSETVSVSKSDVQVAYEDYLELLKKRRRKNQSKGSP
jgi:hypothetical protein